MYRLPEMTISQKPIVLIHSEKKAWVEMKRVKWRKEERKEKEEEEGGKREERDPGKLDRQKRGECNYSDRNIKLFSHRRKSKKQNPIWVRVLSYLKI